MFFTLKKISHHDKLKDRIYFYPGDEYNVV